MFRFIDFGNWIIYFILGIFEWVEGEVEIGGMSFLIFCLLSMWVEL